MAVKKEKYLLIDTDAGSDDALALMMALSAHKDPQSPTHIVGIVCCHGNTSVENVVVNAFRTLDSFQEDKVSGKYLHAHFCLILVLCEN